jgi:adenine-specific DNA-methyltransferase
MKLSEILEEQLKKEPNFVTDNGELKKWVALNKAQNFDEELIGLLLENETLKEKFFVKVKDVLVFKQNLFIDFLEQKNYLNDSYTRYKNKVGLTIDGKYLKQRNEVALVWPFKDCILEGGQSREEQKREEIFFNEILAQDEITQLLEPKVLTNAKVYDKEGEHPFNGFTRDAEINRKRGLPEDTITDNLIIKGNNLLALHSLKKEFAGKVKLIYIDPPYNTGNDGFKYNDSFNHSTWLTFMKNRLEIARYVLKDDGVIFITCDDNEGGYLKVLLDEIFGQENFVANFIWKHRKSSQNDIDVSLSHNYNFCFAKNRKKFKLFPLETNSEKFSNPDNDPRGPWVADPFDAPNIRENLSYEIKNPTTGEIYLPPKGRHWRFSKEKYEDAIKDNRIIFGKTGTSRPQYKRFLFEAEAKGENPFTIWDDIDTATNATKQLMKLFDEKVFSTPKPESLLERILKISTSEKEIVLDYHLGSGTTAAVAQKMNRQYIGIEQMDYIETVAVERLKKVIEGEQGGISKSVNWQGGGAFVYLELKKYNETFIEQIEEAKDTETLLQIWELMKTKSFLNYNVDIKKQDEHIEEFKKLSLKEQKQHLCEILDKNQLYVNLSSLNDADFECTEEEKKVTKDFYKLSASRIKQIKG